MRILMHFSLFNSIFDIFYFFLMMRYIDKIFCLHSFQTVKVDRFVEKKVEQKKTTIFLSYLISSPSPWSLKSKKIN